MKGKQLYIGNLDGQITEELLRELFAEYGYVNNVKIIKGRGFGFVEMRDPDDANIAKINLNDTELFGRRIIVDDAKPKRKNYKNRRYKFTKEVA